MKRFIALYFVLILVISSDSASYAVGKDPIFSDVPEDAWYASFVDVCYREGLLNGVGGGRFNPDGIVSLAEMFTACARLHSRLTGTAIPKLPDNGLRGLVFFTDLEGSRVATLNDNTLANTTLAWILIATKEPGTSCLIQLLGIMVRRVFGTIL